MTYEQILKEFDEWYPDWGTDMIAKAKTATEIMMGESEIRRRNSFKSFLKQSFIKYLEGEVEETKAMIAHTPDEVAKLNQHLPSTLQQATYSEAVGYCKAVGDKITHLQAQIKELQ